jgi:hypothetical protein
METIAIIDTSICTDNLGDEIIMDAINGVVSELFPDAYIFRVPSHEALSDRTRRFISNASFCFVGGTNLLSSDIRMDGLWRIGSADAKVYGGSRTVCFGTGWADYMPTPTQRTQTILKTCLSSVLIHSVRDSYTQNHLKQIGLDAVNTCCPTTWSLTPEHCVGIPSARAPAVIFTLSAWRRDATADSAFVKILRRHYRQLFFFPQMQDDYQYFRTFGWDDVRIPATTAEAYSRFLENENVDFVGTRLHGGIRALQKQRRSLILAIDNRAAEIGKDTGLPVIPRRDIARIEAWLEGGSQTTVRLPWEAINSWKAQFADDRRRRILVTESSHREKNSLERIIRGSIGSTKRIVKSGLRLIR